MHNTDSMSLYQINILFILVVIIFLGSCASTIPPPPTSDWQPVKGETYSSKFLQIMELAKKGDSVGQLNIGLMYYFGDGVKNSHRDADLWLKRSADEGNNADAQFALGNIAQLGKFWWQDEVDKSYQPALDREAIYYYGKAASQGHEKAMFKEARTWEQMGYSNPYSSKETVNTSSRSRYEPLAKRGIPEAQYRLGILWSREKLQYDVQNPSRKAFLWLSIAEINGIKEASEKLNTLTFTHPKLSYCPIRTLIERCIGSNYQDCDMDWPDNPNCLTPE